MELFISDIPEEGLHRSGVLPRSIFELSADDSIQPKSDITYDANIHAFDDLLTFHGSLKGDFKLQCSTCLEFFDYKADFQNWSSDIELEEKQKSFDLAEIIREDFLLQLPSHPHCDEMVEGRSCPKSHFLVEEQIPLEEEAKPEGGDDLWGALDSLD